MGRSAMINYVVTVMCVFGISNCPMPKEGYHSDLPARNKGECEKRAEQVIRGFGYPTKDFVISCREK